MCCVWLWGLLLPVAVSTGSLMCKRREMLDLFSLSKEGDIYIGGIFTVKCESFEFRTFRFIQTMIFATKDITRSPVLLPNATLGYRIYDSCNLPRLSVRAAFELINGQEPTSLQQSCHPSSLVPAIVAELGSSQSLAVAASIDPFKVPMTMPVVTQRKGMANSTEATASPSDLTDIERGSPDKTVEVILIVIVAGSLSLVTITGNILVMLSIKVNRQLQTINNYFIFSLACADLIIGVVSMNLYTIYIVIGYWTMGPLVCDLWLALDYVVSNASVMNLLIISFDRYFCVTKPLSYPVKRTTKMAGMMIAAAWVLSFILWAPAILFWQFIVGERTVNEGECYVQFFSNPVVTFGTAIAAFYLPVIIMTILYVHISHASKSQIKRDKKEPELKKGTVSPSLVRGKIMKPNDGNTSSAPDGLQEAKVQNGKVAGEVMADNCGQGEEEEDSNDSTSLSVVPSIQEEGGGTEESTNVSTAQSRCRINSSKLSCTKVVTKSQKSDNCATTVEIVSGNKNGEGREITAAHKVFNPVKSPAKKKKGAVTREKKVTRTILAILLAFIITWTPYNVMVLINTFCSICVPNTVWMIGYWLCYINSTVNPACYALCNATFKKTFKQLLLCQYKNIGAKK